MIKLYSIRPLRWIPMQSKGILTTAHGGRYWYEVLEIAEGETAHGVNFWPCGYEKHAQIAPGHRTIEDAQEWAQKHHESKLVVLLTEVSDD